MICFVLMKLWVYKKLEAVNNDSFCFEPKITLLKYFPANKINSAMYFYKSNYDFTL